jgi:hypothetical protein
MAGTVSLPNCLSNRNVSRETFPPGNTYRMQQEEFSDRIAGYIAYQILIILQIPLSCLSPFEPLSFYLDIGYSILGVGYSSAASAEKNSSIGYAARFL